jgi:hypothetical protein
VAGQAHPLQRVGLVDPQGVSSFAPRAVQEGAPERRGRAMTTAQKQLLRAVPVAAVIVGGLLLFKFSRFRAAWKDHEQLQKAEAHRTSNQLNTSVVLMVLPEIESHIKTMDAAVEKIEALAPDLDADGKKQLVEPIDKAVAAIEQRRQHIKQLNRDPLPQPVRDRLTAAEAKCDALLERLNRLRPADDR